MGIFYYIFYNNIPEMIYFKANLRLPGMLAVDSQSIEINNIIIALHSSPICLNQFSHSMHSRNQLDQF